MTLSLLQLNINADNYWNKLITFLTSHDFDIIQLQELSGKDTISGNVNSKIDTFAELQKIVNDKYEGKLAIGNRYTSNPSTSYMGNATFYKKRFQLLSQKIIYLNQIEKPFPSDALSFEDQTRTLLHLQLETNDKTISFLNTHFAWAKTSKEEPHQAKQGEKLVNYMRTVPPPFILSGDFNLDPQQSTIKKIDNLAHNLTTEHHITNTLNPRTHRAQHLFPQGIAIDYIFTSKEIQVEKFEVITEDLSDHYGLSCVLSI